MRALVLCLNDTCHLCVTDQFEVFFIQQAQHTCKRISNVSVEMAPRENTRGTGLVEPASDPGVDLSLSLSVGGDGRKRATELVKEGGVQVKRQRKCGAEGGVRDTGCMYQCHAQLEKLVPIGTSLQRSASVVTDRDSGYLIGGSGTNSDSSTTTEQSQLNHQLSTQNTQYITKPIYQNPKPNRIFPKTPKMPFVTVKRKEPNAPPLTGFLYRVTGTDNVFIVCACHGTFFSPTGFVEHAGWTNAINPLRLIVVKPF